MGFSIVNGLQIEGLASCVPKNKINNLEFGKKIYGEEAAKIIKATGIKERHICRKENSSSEDLCYQAASTLLEKGDFNKDEIGAIINVTFTPSHILPNNSSSLQYRLGLSQEVLAFDLNLACSGYPFGLYTAGLIANNLKRKVLLLDGDKQSHLVSANDKSTGLLFGDAGTATVVSYNEDAEDAFFYFESFGEGGENIIIPDGGSKNRITEESLKPYNDSFRRPLDMYMNGMEVFKFVISRVPAQIKKLIYNSGIDYNNLDYLVLHQANEYMIKQIPRLLKFDLDKVPISISKYGNTSSSTIPLTICSELSDQISNGTKKIILSGFGAGLSVGSAIINFDKCKCFGVEEYDY